jgi:hypothetical protein
MEGVQEGNSTVFVQTAEAILYTTPSAANASGSYENCSVRLSVLAVLIDEE